MSWIVKSIKSTIKSVLQVCTFIECFLFIHMVEWNITFVADTILLKAIFNTTKACISIFNHSKIRGLIQELMAHQDGQQQTNL